MTRSYVQGDPAKRFAFYLQPVQRVPGMTPCLEWQGFRNKAGYGRFKDGVSKSPWLAHRYAMKLAGRLDERLHVMHACDNPPCCNVEHLANGTDADNHADMHAKERHAFGERHTSARLTEEQAREIINRYRTGERLTSIHRDFDISYITVLDCAQGRSWGHIHNQLPALDIAEIRARQRPSHCPQRHPYDEANTALRRNGVRRCRECDREYHRTRKAQKAVVS